MKHKINLNNITIIWNRLYSNLKIFSAICSISIALMLLGTIVSVPQSYGTLESTIFSKLTVYDSDSFDYKCADGKTVTIKSNGIHLDAKKSGSSFTGTWKLTGEDGGVKSGSISSGKVSSPDKEGLTPVSFSGPIKSDNLCAKGSSSNSQTMDISTHCGGDDDVYVNFKSGGASNKNLAHVSCS